MPMPNSPTPPGGILILVGWEVLGTVGMAGFWGYTIGPQAEQSPFLAAGILILWLAVGLWSVFSLYRMSRWPLIILLWHWAGAVWDIASGARPWDSAHMANPLILLGAAFLLYVSARHWREMNWSPIGRAGGRSPASLEPASFERPTP